MKRLFVLFALTAMIGCGDRSPVAPTDDGLLPSPFEEDLRSDPRMLELVGLSMLTAEELLALGYPAENLTPEHGQRLLGSLRASYGRIPRLARKCERSPFSVSLADRSGLVPAQWPEWLVALRKRLANARCNWPQVYDATNDCGMAAVGAVAITRGVPAGYVVFGACVVKVGADHCSFSERS